MCHEHRHPVGNLDTLSDLQPHRVNDTWPDLQRPPRTDGLDEHREDPVTDPAELAEIAQDFGDTVAVDDVVDLGPAGTEVDS
jgi:hypothetical protein